MACLYSQQLAILLTMLYMVEHWERHLYTMEVVRNWETHAGRSAAVKMIMKSQIMGTHLSSSNSLSNHTALRLQQLLPRLLASLSNRLGGTAPLPTA